MPEELSSFCNLEKISNILCWYAWGIPIPLSFIWNKYSCSFSVLDISISMCSLSLYLSAFCIRFWKSCFRHWQCRSLFRRAWSATCHYQSLGRYERIRYSKASYLIWKFGSHISSAARLFKKQWCFCSIGYSFFEHSVPLSAHFSY